MFCGDKLRLLGLVLKELTGLLCVTTRVRRVLIQIRERIVIKLRTAAPHELIGGLGVWMVWMGQVGVVVTCCVCGIWTVQNHFRLRCVPLVAVPHCLLASTLCKSFKVSSSL